MEEDPNRSPDRNSSGDRNQSLVGKFKSIISNASLSKWFSRNDSSVERPLPQSRRSRGEEECELQPPPKRAKLPVDVEPLPAPGPSGARRRFEEARAAVTDSDDGSTSERSEAGKAEASIAEAGSVGFGISTPRDRRTRSLFDTSAADACGTPSTSSLSSPFLSRSPATSRTPAPAPAKRPAFDPSAFNSPSFVDRTLSTRRIVDSPFYPGRTAYGGASAYPRPPSKQPPRRGDAVRITPANAAGAGARTPSNGPVLGKTAKRILDTLEQYSSPVGDAKKVPFVFRGSQSSIFTSSSPYSKSKSQRTASNSALTVPTLPDLLRAKTRLQKGTEGIKRIVKSAASEGGELPDYGFRSDAKCDRGGGHRVSGKLKTGVSSARLKKKESAALEELPDQVGLSKVALELKELPKFEFQGLVLPGKRSGDGESHGIESGRREKVEKGSNFDAVVVEIGEKKEEDEFKGVEVAEGVKKEEETKEKVGSGAEKIEKDDKSTVSNGKGAEFRFSEPLIVSENLKSIVAVNNFKFSEPLAKWGAKKSDEIDENIVNFKMPSKKKNGEKIAAEMEQIKSDLSIFDDSEAKKKKKTPSKSEPWGGKFKPAIGSWECESCLIRNQNGTTRCAACSTEKPVGSEVKTDRIDSKTVPSKKPVESEVRSGLPVAQSFGSEFKMDRAKQWECDTCMVRNGSESTKCLACETPRKGSVVSGGKTNGFGFGIAPKGAETLSKADGNDEKKIASFGSAFVTKTDEWECKVCMVRNKSSSVKCQCCDASKPNLKGEGKEGKVASFEEKKGLSSFNFGVDKSTVCGFKFGVANESKSNFKVPENIESVFGEKAKKIEPEQRQTFTFGVPKSLEKKIDEKTVEIDEKPKETVGKLPDYETHVSNVEKIETDKKESCDFKFGVANKQVESKEIEDLSKKPTHLLSMQTSNRCSNLLNFSTNPVESKPKKFFSFGSDKVPEASKDDVRGVSGVSDVFRAPEAAKSQNASMTFRFGSNASDQVSRVSGAVSGRNGLDSGSIVSPKVGEAAKKFSFGEPAEKRAQIAPQVQVQPFGFGQRVSKEPAFSFATGGEAGVFGSSGVKEGQGQGHGLKFMASDAAGVAAGGGGRVGNGKMFNFGSASTAGGKAGFSFGATAGAGGGPGGAGVAGGFSFGGVAAPTAGVSQVPSTSGFNFSTAAPSFDANVKPTFNFTDGNAATFTAQPAASDQPRKFKRAVRRTQR